MKILNMQILKGLSLAVLTFFFIGAAQANVISGELWNVTNSVASNAVPANVPGTIADVTFDVNSPLNFTTAGSVQTFLNSGGAFNIVENTSGALALPISPSIITFTGFVTVTNGQSFTVTHDDGLTLIIGGTDLGFATGPTGPVQSTANYTGPSGTFPFQLVYGECCGGSAVLQVDLSFSNTQLPPVGSAPEPATLALFGLGLASFAASRRRRR